jgi:hypothetical protein
VAAFLAVILDELDIGVGSDGLDAEEQEALR